MNPCSDYIDVDFMKSITIDFSCTVGRRPLSCDNNRRCLNPKLAVNKISTIELQRTAATKDTYLR